MIIQCPTCLTKFRLDDSKVSDEGTRVRCTKCKEVFVARKEIPVPPPPPPPVQPETPAPDDDLDFSFSTTFEDEGEGEKKQETSPLQFGGGFEEEAPKKEESVEETSFSFVSPSEEYSKNEELAEETPFSFGTSIDEAPVKEGSAEDTPFSFGAPAGEEPAAVEKDEKGFDWSAMSYGEVNLPGTQDEADEPPLGFDFSKSEETAFGDFEFKDETTQEPSPGSSFAAQEEPVITPPPVEQKATFREERSTPPPQFAPSTEGLIDNMEDELQDEFYGEFEPEKKTSLLKKKSIISLLLVAVFLVSGFFIWKNYIASGKGVINLENITGYYAQNAEAGNIFVISGRAVNNTSQARSFFQVKGVLFNKKGEKLVQKEVYCGNIFSSKELISLSRAKIESDLVNKVGGSLSNINLAPGKSVPFMIVYFDLPPDMTEFSVSNKSSQLASE